MMYYYIINKLIMLVNLFSYFDDFYYSSDAVKTNQRLTDLSAFAFY